MKVVQILIITGIMMLNMSCSLLQNDHDSFAETTNTINMFELIIDAAYDTAADKFTDGTVNGDQWNEIVTVLTSLTETTDVAAATLAQYREAVESDSSAAGGLKVALDSSLATMRSTHAKLIVLFSEYSIPTDRIEL